MCLSSAGLQHDFLSGDYVYALEQTTYLVATCGEANLSEAHTVDTIQVDAETLGVGVDDEDAIFSGYTQTTLGIHAVDAGRNARSFLDIDVKAVARGATAYTEKGAAVTVSA